MQGLEQLPRTPFGRSTQNFPSKTFVNKAVLVCLLILLWRRIGAQPQRDVGRLHSLPYQPHKLGVQRIQIRLISELGREGFQRLSCVILPAVEAPIYEGLDAAA